MKNIARSTRNYLDSGEAVGDAATKFAIFYGQLMNTNSEWSTTATTIPSKETITSLVTFYSVWYVCWEEKL